MAMKIEKTTAKKTSGASLIYVTRDIERALGSKPHGSYFILTNRTPYAESIHAQYPENVFLIEKTESGEPLDTYELLKAGEKITNGLAEKNGGKIDIIVFKNTARIEEFCQEKKWRLLNPKASLAEEIENKITQVAWLKKSNRAAEDYLPPHSIKKISEIKLKDNDLSAPFMIQWAHGHTGDGTIFISADKAGEKMLATLREKFPNREARITSYINGPVFTVNICINAAQTLIGNISAQITGMLPFTDNPWSTVGNDWSLTHSILNEEKIKQFHEIATTIGECMRESGWLGLFGIDCIYDIERDNLHLIEINARQPASTTYESQLQENMKALAPEHFKDSVTIFEAHLTALQNQPISEKNAQKSVEINDGAQIIMRIPTLKELQKTGDEINKISNDLRSKNYTVIEYENTKPGSDLIRIQSEQGIMESQNKFNSRGKEILEIVTGVATEYDII